MYKLFHCIQERNLFQATHSWFFCSFSLLCSNIYLVLHNGLVINIFLSPDHSVASLALCCDLVSMAEQCGLCYPELEEKRPAPYGSLWTIVFSSPQLWKITSMNDSVSCECKTNIVLLVICSDCFGIVRLYAYRGVLLGKFPPREPQSFRSLFVWKRVALCYANVVVWFLRLTQ